MVDKEKLLEALRSSLEDRRLSKEERHDLKSLVGDAAKSSTERAFLRNRIFDVARESAMSESDPLELIKWCHDVMKAIEASKPARRTQLDVLFSPGETCLGAINSLLSSAKTKIDICVFTITDNRITSEILQAAKRGVATRVISDNDKSEDLGSDIERLRDSGVLVRLDRSENHMHHKFAIFDDQKVLTGSYNWTRSAATKNRENILISNALSAVQSYSDEFERLWREFE
ncbi:MAG: DUF1669 domain-containing protein [Kofleriaceae bacterium]|nr:DUF1669 domain-containing protein [Kofleriaceae bacterium]